jgi:hypothetical protein
VIAEDSVLLREGLVRLLTDAGLEVVAAVEDAERCCARSTSTGRDLRGRHPDAADHTDEGVRAPW